MKERRNLMYQIRNELEKVSRILSSVERKLESLLYESEGTERTKGRPNNGILKEYNGEPLLRQQTDWTTLELADSSSRTIDEQNRRILLLLKIIFRRGQREL